MDDIEQILPILFPCQTGARSLVELYDMIMDDRADPSIYEEMDHIRLHLATRESTDVRQSESITPVLPTASPPSSKPTSIQTNTHPVSGSRGSSVDTDSVTGKPRATSSLPQSSLTSTIPSTRVQKNYTRHTVRPASIGSEQLVPSSRRTVIKVADRPGHGGINRSRLAL